METSTTIGKIAESLSKAQGQLRAASFDASNPHFKSKYATLAAIMEVARPVLSANGIAVVQGTSVEGEPGRVNVTTILIHAVSGEWIKDILSVRPAVDNAQGVGSAITYARRYSLSAMVGIVADDDDDGESSIRPSNEKPVQHQAKELTEIKKVQNQIQIQSQAQAQTQVQNEARPQIQNQTAARTQPTTTKSDGNTTAAAAKDTSPKTTDPNVNGRISKIKEIFSLSAGVGETPDQMRIRIGNLIGSNRPIRESAGIPNDKLDQVLNVYRQEHANKTEKVAA